jgi:cell division protein ZapA
MAMSRSLGGRMDSHYAGWGKQKAGTPTLPNGTKNVNGTSQKRGAIYRALQKQMMCDMFVAHSLCYLRAYMSGPVKVEIFGQTYSIQGDLDQAYVQKLAKYVDERMNAIADVTRTVDTQKVAVLAALAIADELHGMQRDRTDREELLREQAERCLTLVERALKQTA